VRACVISLALYLALASLAGAAVTTDTFTVKATTHPAVHRGGDREGGETIADAVVIPSLPFDDTGSTCDNIDDYDEVCPYVGSTSPDVVYVFTPSVDMFVDIQTCNSGYDTKLYVYENAYTPGAPYACNDDNDACPGPLYRSWIRNLELSAGDSYYIVVDGYGGDCGDYELHVLGVDPPLVCEPTCPGDALTEGEPTCHDGYVDEYNGGCNSDPPAFQALPPDPVVTVCGESGVYDGLTVRDTDWYEIELDGDREVTLTMCADFPALFGFVDASLGCSAPNLYDHTFADPYVESSLTTLLSAGTWWVFVAPADWGSYPCGVRYVLTVEGITVSPVAELSWTTLKAMYR